MVLTAVAFSEEDKITVMEAVERLLAGDYVYLKEPFNSVLEVSIDERKPHVVRKMFSSGDYPLSMNMTWDVLVLLKEAEGIYKDYTLDEFQPITIREVLKLVENKEPVYYRTTEFSSPERMVTNTLHDPGFNADHFYVKLNVPKRKQHGT